MAEVAHHTIEDERNFVFTGSYQRKLITAFVVGLLMVVAGVLIVMFMPAGHGHEEASHTTEAAHHGSAIWLKRLFANLWLNAVFFNGIALIGVFFCAVQYVAYAGWSSTIKRVPEAFGYFLPVTGVILLVLFFLGGHDLFHWTHKELYIKGGPEFDKILYAKSAYLNVPFFLIRMVAYFVLWFMLFLLIRRTSLNEDKLPVQDFSVKSVSYWNKNVYNSAVFIFVFAITSSMCAWDWIMSVDPHWFSTMFGWYCFASWFVSGLATITLTIIILKENGYLQVVNENHLHDLGKFMFAFSVFWTYIWFSQFLLYYYANIPEEIIYFKERISGHNGNFFGVFFLNIFINFVFPFLSLMTRGAKRKMLFLKIVACAILMGHYLDFYMMIMPGTLGENAGFGFMEFGTIIVFASMFIFVISRNIASVSLIAKNDPYIKESVHHVVV